MFTPLLNPMARISRRGSMSSLRQDRIWHQKDRRSFHTEFAPSTVFSRCDYVVSAGDQGSLVVLVSEDESRCATPIAEAEQGSDGCDSLVGPSNDARCVLLVDGYHKNLYPLTKRILFVFFMERAEHRVAGSLHDSFARHVGTRCPNDAVFEGHGKLRALIPYRAWAVREIELMESLKDLGTRPSLLRLADCNPVRRGGADAAIRTSVGGRQSWVTPDPAIVFLHLGHNIDALDRSGRPRVGRTPSF